MIRSPITIRSIGSRCNAPIHLLVYIKRKGSAVQSGDIAPAVVPAAVSSQGPLYDSYLAFFRSIRIKERLARELA
jgi:hypothetical protein